MAGESGGVYFVYRKPSVDPAQRISIPYTTSIVATGREFQVGTLVQRMLRPNYSLLRKGTGDDPLLTYINPRADLSKYSAPKGRGGEPAKRNTQNPW